MQDYQVLPLKYRPQTLDEIWIQEHIKTTLKKAIDSNRVAHAYIFAGPRGVGKTTTARILAKSLNCIKGPSSKPCQECSVCREITNSSSLDVLEIDGASNRGIDQVRELRENVKFLPTSCPYKIYIIDEVHMLTTEAFNALLKTLEEPPRHVKFIFATTAPQKVPATILSRCQRFDFRRATVEEIVKRLAWIGEKEKIDVSEEALFAIGKRADGSIRDAESMLDQIRIYQTNRINLKDVEELLGIISSNIFFEYTEALTAGDPKLIFEFVDKIFSTGYDFIEFFTGLLEHFRLLIMVKLNINKNILGVAQAGVSRFESQSNKFSIEKLIVVMQHIADNEEIIKRTSEPKILFEILSLNLLNALALPQNSQSISGTGKTGEQQNLKTIWQGLITELSEKRPYLANHLELAQLSDVVDNKIVITCNQRHIKEFIESEKTEIESYFSLLLNRLVNISVTCTDEKNKDSRKFTNNEKTESPKPDVDSKISEEFSKGTETKSPDKIFKDLFPNSKKLK